MAEIINLRSWKKKTSRAAEKSEADGNAARFGRSKALKKLEQARASKDRSDLDGHRREGGTFGHHETGDTPDGR